MVGAVAAMSCGGGGYTVVVRFESAALTDQARRVEISLVSACSGESTDGAPSVDALRTIELVRGWTGSGLGNVKAGTYGLYVRAFGASCNVIARGCRDVQLVAGGSGEVAVTATGLAGPYDCAPDAQCTDGVCLAADAGAQDGGGEGGAPDGAVDGGPVDGGTCRCAPCASCDEAGACVPDSSRCNPGSYCDPIAGCTPGTPCPLDGSPCPPSADLCATARCDTSQAPAICVPELATDGTPCMAGAAAGQCRSGICCTGCWLGGACVAGNTPAACGGGGGLCSVCDDGNPCTTDTCDASGTCGTVPDDTAACPGGTCHGGACCTGCWDGSTCQPGTDDALCGEAGAACVACDAAGCPPTTCSGGMCVGTQTIVLAGGFEHYCAVVGGGGLRCWGKNDSGDIGDGTSSGTAPAPVGVSGGASWTTVAVGGSHTCAIRTDGSLWCWGSGTSGQLGDGRSSGSAVDPARVGTDTDWTMVAAGVASTCAIKSDGSLYCWGNNSDGQLGVMASEVDVPTRVNGVWVSIAMHGAHSCALQAGGLLFCWGSNKEGQIGDGTLDSQPLPERVGAGTGWVQVTVGGDVDNDGFTCAIRAPGTLWCWGAGSNGVLGSTHMNQEAPVQIGAATDLVELSADDRHVCGVRSDGTLWCWGQNMSDDCGQTGVPMLDMPTQVGTRTDWVHVQAARDSTCALASDGSVWCFGRDYYGALGDGSVDSSGATPVQACL